LACVGASAMEKEGVVPVNGENLIPATMSMVLRSWLQ
jgi:hypothetical protein